MIPTKSRLLSLALALTLALVFAPHTLAGDKKMKKKGEKRAKAVHKVAAEYPAEAKETRAEGSVVAKLSINADGTVSDVKIVEGAKVFRKATVTALKQWKFEPMAAPANFQVTMRFRLPDQDGKAKDGKTKS